MHSAAVSSSGHDDQGDGGRLGLENLERCHPAKPRHRIVGEHDIRPELAQHAAKGVGFVDALRLAVERCAAELAYSELRVLRAVLDHQNAQSLGGGHRLLRRVIQQEPVEPDVGDGTGKGLEVHGFNDIAVGAQGVGALDVRFLAG